MSWAILNDTLMPLAEARIPVNDRSFLFGDSLYEVVATEAGQPFFVQAHLDRLRASAAGIYLELPWSDSWFFERIQQGLAVMPERQQESIYIRIVVSRGASDFNIDTRLGAGPAQATFIFKSLGCRLQELSRTPLSLAIPPQRRNPPEALSPALKTGNYLNNILALYQAQQMGAMDALMLDLQGRITEATTANFFCVREGVLCTPHTKLGILHGITRKLLLQLAENLDIPTRECEMQAQDLAQAEEAFISNAVVGLRAVNRVDAYRFPEHLGPIGTQLADAYWQYVKEHLDHV